jgi:hypothetical protein
MLHQFASSQSFSCIDGQVRGDIVSSVKGLDVLEEAELSNHILGGGIDRMGDSWIILRELREQSTRKLDTSIVTTDKCEGVDG